MEPVTKLRPSRREFLRMATVATFGVMAASCAPAPAPTSAPPTAAQAQEEATQAPESTAVPEATEVPAATAAPAASGATKIVIFVGFGTGTDPGQIEGHNKLAEEYNAAHKDIQIEFLTVPHEERNTKFSTMVAGNLAPDICMPIGVGGVAAFFDEWLDIKPYIDRDKYDLSVFVGLTVQYHTYPDRTLGLPIGVYPEVLYYNEDLFDTAGVDYPPHQYGDETWTYDAMAELARKLTFDEAGNDATAAGFDWKKTKQWGWDTWEGLRDMAPRWGGSPLCTTPDYKKAIVNSPEWLAAAQWMADLVWKLHVRANSEQATAFSEASDPMGSGRVAMWDSQSWMAYAYQGWTDAFNWNMAAIPAGPVGVWTDNDADTFVLSKHGTHQDQAWEVAKWFASEEIIPRLTSIWGCVPARSANLAKWKSEQEAAWPNKDWQVMLDGLDHSGVPNTECWIPDPEKITDTVNKHWDLINTGENTNVKEVMDQCNTAVQAILDDYWKAHS